MRSLGRILLVFLTLSAVLPAAVSPAATAPLPSIATRTLKLERHDGFVPWYWDAGEARLLIEPPRPGKEFLYAAGIAGGAGTIDVSLDRGQLGNLALCVFERSGRNMLMRQRQTGHRADIADRERVRVVDESFPTAVLAALPIVAETGDRVLLDATAFLMSDRADVARALKDAEQGEWQLQGDLSAFHLERCGAFPRNSEFEVTHTFTSNAPGRGVAAVSPDGRTLSLRIHHTFLALPEPGFEPRTADPRTGFFTTAFLDHAAPFTEALERAFITRWRLVKQDPRAARSKPVEPIVFYLDRGMPEPERAAVREAALWWNHAFEEAGFIDAVVIRDMPEGATFLDARYSGIQWTSRAERAWSIGQFQSDPRTGEILHAVVLLDSHRRRTTSRMWQNLAPPGTRRCTAGDAPDLSVFAAPAAAATDRAADAPQVDETALVLARLRYLSAHELGHTLGIEHNMAATTFGWGSVMDYLGPHIEARGDALDLSDAYPTDIGAWDRLTVRWGYTPGLDRADLSLMVKAALDGGVVWPHESDARWNEYDWGSDPVAWLGTSLAARRIMLQRFGPGQLRTGEPVYDLQKRFNLIYLYHRFAILAAQRQIGGEYVTNAVAGDGQVPRRPVPASVQRGALEALMGTVMPNAMRVPDAALAALIPTPNGTSRSREQFPSEAGDAFSELSAQRVLARLVIAPLLAPDRAMRLLDPAPVVATAALLAGDAGAPLTLDALLDRVLEGTWAPLHLRDVREARAQRVTQRVALESAMQLAANDKASPEVRGATLAALERFAANLKKRRGSAPDDVSHIALAQRDLTAFLEKGTLPPAAPALATPPGRPIGALAR